MSDTRCARAHTCLVALLSLTLAAGTAACGSGDNDGGAKAEADNATVSSDGAPAAANRGNDKAQLRQLLDDLQADYIAGRAEAYCSRLTAAGREQFAEVARDYEHGETCEDFVTVTSKLTRESVVKQLPTVVLGVRVNGDRATLRVSDGGRPPQNMKFVKIGGEWKLPDPGVRSALAGQAVK